MGRFSFELFGDYNLMNAGAALALAHQLHWDLSKCQQALSTFKGVKRRQEILGEIGGVLVLEDFAHHPTAVKEIISSVQKHYAFRVRGKDKEDEDKENKENKKSKGRLFALFEPRSATSCRNIFQEEYFHAFKQAQHVWVKKAFEKKDLKEEQRFSSEKLCEQLKTIGIDAHSFQDVDKMLPTFCKQLCSGDVVLIMSNGSFKRIVPKAFRFFSKQDKSKASFFDFVLVSLTCLDKRRDFFVLRPSSSLYFS